MSLTHTREERDARLFQGSIHRFSLGVAAQKLRDEPEYLRNGRNGTTLMKNQELRVVLEVVGAGFALARHRVAGAVTVQVLEGELRVGAREEVLYLRAGDLVTLPPREPHSVEAVHDAAFLITVAPEVD